MDDKDKEQFADQDTLTIEPLGSDMKFREIIRCLPVPMAICMDAWIWTVT